MTKLSMAEYTAFDVTADNHRVGVCGKIKPPLGVHDDAVH
jgi:hypothetical protein